VLFLGCRASGVDASSEGRAHNYGPTDKSIRSWQFIGIDHPEPEIIDSDDGTVGTIAISVPYSTSLVSLKAEIDLAAPTIEPDPGTAQDYTTPVQFTVTPEEGEPRVYTVTVSRLPSTVAAITSITVTGMTGMIWSDRNITVNMPYDANISAITPTIRLSAGASVSPTGPQNFGAALNNTITYTVRAADNVTTANYNVTMQLASSDARRITSFSVKDASDAVRALITTTINDGAGTITVQLPAGHSTTFTPEIGYEGSSIAPDPLDDDTPVNFSTSQTYRVTAYNSEYKDYTVTVSNKGPASATLNNVTANGSALSSKTTQLALNFSTAVTTLTVGDITLSDGYTKGALAESGGYSWTLGITKTDGWLQDATVTVTVANPVGYTISGGTKTAKLNAANQQDLMVKFGIKSAGYDGSFDTDDVAETFTAIKDYIGNTNPETAGEGKSMRLGAIKTNDYVQLKVKVDAYNGAGAIVGVFYDGVVVKAEVVGINTYAGKNDNDSGAHVVFRIRTNPEHFDGHQRRMNATGTNAGGYGASEMRKYLTPEADVAGGKYYAGLLAAGVPPAVFWKARRVIGKTASTTEILEDSVFLPTEYELTGTNTFSASESTGGRLNAFQTNEDIGWAWFASPAVTGDGRYYVDCTVSNAFCIHVLFPGNPNSIGIFGYKANEPLPFAPAFCVR
jgi:hypothetical protein